MQTFLPYADFAKSAACLDNKRLGKQRVECLQILKALFDPNYGWQNHPAVRMWRGHADSLYRYALQICLEWQKKGFGIQNAMNKEVTDRFFAKVEKTDSCWNWIGAIQSDGYGSFWFNRTAISAHVAAWLIFKPTSLGNLHVLHKCDNRRCVNPDHLFLGTNLDNTIDRDKKGRLSNPFIKLNYKLAKEIRESLLPRKALAKFYKVSDTTIRRIKENKIWRAERFA